MSTVENRDTRQGFLYAGGAYLVWGFLPLYMKMLSHIPAWEILPHRILWSLPIAGFVMWWNGFGADIAKALRNPRTLALALVTSLLVSVNWGIYVWAVISGRALETALGYYINPLFSILLAAMLVGEKLKGMQWIAIALATSAVAVLTWENGGLPWVSLLLTVTWGFYAYFKKTLPIGATQGFFLEVLILALPAVIVLAWLQTTGSNHFLAGTWKDTFLMVGLGVFTAIPLMLYAMGAKGLRLTTIAIMQYSAPTMVFLIAVFVFKEPFSLPKLVAFGLIWAALAVYTWSLVRAYRQG